MQTLVLFELLEHLLPLSQASAVLLEWRGQVYVPSQKTILVHDFLGKHGSRGDRGYCFMSAQSNSWEIVGGLHEQVARRDAL